MGDSLVMEGLIFVAVSLLLSWLTVPLLGAAVQQAS